MRFDKLLKYLFLLIFNITFIVRKFCFITYIMGTQALGCVLFKIDPISSFVSLSHLILAYQMIDQRVECAVHYYHVFGFIFYLLFFFYCLAYPLALHEHTGRRTYCQNFLVQRYRVPVLNDNDCPKYIHGENRTCENRSLSPDFTEKIHSRDNGNLQLF